MAITGFFSAILVGAIVGALGRLIVPGEQKVSALTTVVVGVVAALLGTALATVFGWFFFTLPFLAELAVQVCIAAVGVITVAGSKSRQPA
ncbi:GlsB/YeaQ/YmgE family stress response membrane protein [Allokutzneria sp. NRRL B-24872]|uniref:GlsB/YeaQ/YmgE family stress response membrane protein n=1 Tax=Allokutzneria sp. NRRL B-24872 TaxID=1137961 RepID=UPI000A38023E|nr:GlsB/YeaQ/YmgE family stress response membrane protein [Allokutzneria sp. NRRL B-24872]